MRIRPDKRTLQILLSNSITLKYAYTTGIAMDMAGVDPSLFEIREHIRAKKLRKEAQILAWLEDNDYPSFVKVYYSRAVSECSLCGKTGILRQFLFESSFGVFTLGKDCAVKVSWGVTDNHIIKTLKEFEKKYVRAHRLYSESLVPWGQLDVFRIHFNPPNIREVDVYPTAITTLGGTVTKRLHKRFLDSIKVLSEVGLFEETAPNDFKLVGWNGLNLVHVRAGTALYCPSCGWIDLKEKFTITDQTDTHHTFECPECGGKARQPKAT